MKTDRLKIFLVGPGYPLRGGPALLNENFCRELIRRGHEVGIISFSLQYPSFLFPGTSQTDTSRPKPDMEILPFINTLHPLSWFRAARYIKRASPDLVIFRYWLPFFGPSLGTIARLISSDTCVMALADNIIPHEKRPGDRLLTRFFLKPLHGVLCMSSRVEQDLLDLDPVKPRQRVHHPLYEVYPPPMEQSMARKMLGLPSDKKIILFFGLIRKYKGLHLLVQAMKNISRSDIVLLVAGDFYEEKKEYEPWLSELQKEGKLILHEGYVPDSEIHRYFCSANVCVQPYLSATNSGISMVSYFYGVPVIATRVGGLPEVIEEGVSGLLTEPNPVSIKKTIEQYFDENMEKSLRLQIPGFRKKFSWDSFLHHVLEFYHKIKKQ